ncbi:hypothetical protein K8354_17410 [Polaribacter litorisediminis]|uniref:hypothetical protein n=1 Tax=Polaribacter litorisediminis TaxID=1908341 RepID=UPI001CBD4D2D|nr:hypothetical protein [Polaribacter litorisediminis]UAM98038.1 hypothetical protein K8354_17410 [Polaribacter litorisediminis]
MKKEIFKILIVFLILSFLGFLTFPKLSVRLNPSESLPSISVSYSWANSSPYALEREVTNILEGGLGI